jgi:hypothetical protein
MGNHDASQPKSSQKNKRDGILVRGEEKGISSGKFDLLGTIEKEEGLNFRAYCCKLHTARIGAIQFSDESV